MATGQGHRGRRLSTRARYALAVAVLLAGHAAMLVTLAAITPWTVDEPQYLAAGMVLAQHFEFDAFSTILHGPLPFLSNQLFFPDGLPADAAVLMQHKLAARLGMIPLALLAALATALLAREAFGRRAALAALLLYCTNPIVLGHACLITADVTTHRDVDVDRVGRLALPQGAVALVASRVGHRPGPGVGDKIPSPVSVARAGDRGRGRGPARGPPGTAVVTGTRRRRLAAVGGPGARDRAVRADRARHPT